VTTDTTPTIEGTSAADAVSVTVHVDGEEAGEATLADGTWSYEFAELAIGTYAVTATATDAAGNESSASAALSLDIRAPLEISGTPTTETVTEEAYRSFAIAASGAVPPYTYSLAGAALPPGFSFDAVTPAITGVTMTAATYAGIVIRVTDGQSNTADLGPFTIEAVYPWDATNNLYVNSEDGDDGNDGLTKETAFKTLPVLEAAAAAIAAATGRVEVGYMAGSMWWAQHDMSAIPGFVARACGDIAALGFPVIRADEIVTGPFQTGADRGDGRMNVLSFEWHHNIVSGQQGQPPHFYDGTAERTVTMSPWQPDLDAMDAGDGGFWHNAGTSGASPVTIYFKPRAGATVFTANKHNWALKVAPDAVVRLFRTMNQGHDNGSTNGYVRAFLDGIVATGGMPHDILAATGRMRHCVTERLMADPRSGIISQEWFKGNEVPADDAEGEWDECVAIGPAGATTVTGFGGHVPPAGLSDATRYKKITLKKSLARNCDAVFRDAMEVDVDEFFIDDGQLTMLSGSANGKSTWKDVRARATGVRGAGPFAGTVAESLLTIDGLRAYVTAPFVNGILAGMRNFRIRRSVICSDTSQPTTIIRDAGGQTVRFEIDQCMVEIRGYAVGSKFIECINTTVKPSGGNNVWSGFGDFRIRDAGVNITYRSLPALQAAQSIEAGSIAADTEAQFGPEQIAAPFFIGTGWTNNGDGTYTQSGAGNGAADRIQWTISAVNSQIKETHAPGAVTDRTGGTVLGATLAAGSYVWRGPMSANFNILPLGVATVVSAISARTIPTGLLNPIRFADPANGDFSIIGDTGITGVGLERPNVEYLDGPASIAEAEAWVIGKKMAA